METIKQHNSIRFDKDNEYIYGQDFRFLKGVPSDIDFYPLEETRNGLIIFIGDKHGIRPEHNLAGEYGNGAIDIRVTDIPHLIDWCRNNVLKRDGKI